MTSIVKKTQPEFRQDLLTKRWVIIAPGRSHRPQDFDTTIRRVRSGPCPFCEGNEGETTPEVLARRAPGSRPNGPGWRVRVVTNKYPAVCTPLVAEALVSGDGPTHPGQGVHEVIIDTPRHLTSLTELSSDEIAEILDVYRERLQQLAAIPHLEHALLFKNVGPTAGASLEHSHSQLLAIPLVPPRIEEEFRAARNAFEESGECWYCAMLREELAAGVRIICRDRGFTVLCPFASRFAYEMWLLPERHQTRFEDLSMEELSGLAVVLREIVRRMETKLARPGYNLMIQTAPLHQDCPFYHWRIEILPCVSRAAGYEWGTGIHINPVSPEEAAQTLRDG